VPNALPPRAATDQPIEPLAAVAEAKPTSSASDSESTRPYDSAEARLEFAFMARIHAAMRSAKLRQALALCAEHERRWPRGIFQQERDGVRALATCKLQLPEAQSRAGGFLAEYPHGALAPSVRAACERKLKPQ
jgi:head-tail adaptor